MPSAAAAGAPLTALAVPMAAVDGFAAAVVAAVPTKPGFAFGLTCLALFVGSVPTAVGWTGLASTIVVFVLGGVGAVALWVGLSRLDAVSGGRRRAASYAIQDMGA